MSPSPVLSLLVLLLVGVTQSVRGQVLPPFRLPSQLDITSLNGVAPGDGASGSSAPLRTSSRHVAAAFSTDANAAFVWVVAPTGTTGSSAIFPGSEEAAAMIPFGRENQVFEVRLCATAIAPSAVLTHSGRTFCGDGAPVVLDTEPPEIIVLTLEVDGVQRPYDPSQVLHVNQDFVVHGTVRDNFTPAEEIVLSTDFGGQGGSTTVETGGRFQAQISVANLPDGDYPLVIRAEDVMSDSSEANSSEVRLR